MFGCFQAAIIAPFYTEERSWYLNLVKQNIGHWTTDDETNLVWTFLLSYRGRKQRDLD